MYKLFVFETIKPKTLKQKLLGHGLKKYDVEHRGKIKQEAVRQTLSWLIDQERVLFYANFFLNRKAKNLYVVYKTKKCEKWRTFPYKQKKNKVKYP